MLEEHEEDIEEWYFNHKADNMNEDKSSTSSLETYLCRQGRVLKTKADRKCLDQLDGKKPNKKKVKKIKGDLGETTKEADVTHTEL